MAQPLPRGLWPPSPNPSPSRKAMGHGGYGPSCSGTAPPRTHLPCWGLLLISVAQKRMLARTLPCARCQGVGPKQPVSPHILLSVCQLLPGLWWGRGGVALSLLSWVIVGSWGSSSPRSGAGWVGLAQGPPIC